MLYVVLVFISYGLMIYGKLFLLRAPIRYFALKAEKNVIYNRSVNRVYKIYFAGLILFDIFLIVLLPSMFFGLIFDLGFILIILALLYAKREKGKPFRILFPVYKEENIGTLFTDFAKQDKNCKYMLAVNQTPLFIVSTHPKEEQFTQFLDDLNHVEGLFVPLNEPKMRMMYRFYVVFVVIAFGYVIGFEFIQVLLFNLFG